MDHNISVIPVIKLYLNVKTCITFTFKLAICIFNIVTPKFLYVTIQSNLNV